MNKILLFLLSVVFTSCSTYYYTTPNPQSYTPVTIAEDVAQEEIQTYPSITLSTWNVYSSYWNSYLYTPYYIVPSNFWYFNSPNNYTFTYYNWRPWRFYSWNGTYGWNNWYGNGYGNAWHGNYGWNNWYGNAWQGNGWQGNAWNNCYGGFMGNNITNNYNYFGKYSNTSFQKNVNKTNNLLLKKENEPVKTNFTKREYDYSNRQNITENIPTDIQKNTQYQNNTLLDKKTNTPRVDQPVRTQPQSPRVNQPVRTQSPRINQPVRTQPRIQYQSPRINQPNRSNGRK